MASVLLSRVFWQHAGETAVGYSAAGATAVLGLHAADGITAVPWDLVGSGAVIGALLGLGKSLSSLIVQPANGTASWLRRVVAAPPRGHGWNPIGTNPMDDD